MKAASPATRGAVAQAEMRSVTRARRVLRTDASATLRVLNHFGSSPPITRSAATYRHGSQWYVYTVNRRRSRIIRGRRYSFWSHIPQVTIGKNPKEIARVTRIGSWFTATMTRIRSRNVRSHTIITSGDIMKRDKLMTRSSRFFSGTFGARRTFSFKMYSTKTCRDPHAHRVRWRKR